MARLIPLRDDLGLGPGYHSPQVDVAVRLNTNESPSPPPKEWLDELREALDGVDFHRYPDRSARELREALARLHGTVPERIFAANGSNEVLQCLLSAFGGTGRSCAVFEPTYALHAHIARLTGTTVAAGQRGGDFRIEPGAAVSFLRGTRPDITFVCSPNNPTGGAESPETVQAVVDAAPGLVVVDEAYGQFSPWTSLDRVTGPLPDPGVAVVRTFSKTWSMAAFRLGYVVAQPEIVEACEAVALPYHLDTVKQIGGRLAVAHVREMEERVSRVVEERGRLAGALAMLDVEQWPSDANFILFRPRAKDSVAVWKSLLDRSVLVRDCSTWALLEGCLRVTVGTRDENDAFLGALTEALQ